MLVVADCIADQRRLADHRRRVILVGLGILGTGTGRRCATSGDRTRLFAVALDLLLHPLRHRGQDLLGDFLTGLRGLAGDPRKLPDVRALFDLAQGPPPVRVVRAKLLLQRRKPVAEAGVADLALHDIADPALDVGVQVRRGLLLHPQEVLFVQRLETLHGRVDVVEDLLDIDRFGLCGLRSHVPGG